MNIALNKDELYNLLNEPTKENMRAVLQQKYGESNEIDYKVQWPEKSKLAKIVLAMANNGGGVIIVGLEEREDGTMHIKGLDSFKDPAEIGQDLEKYIPKTLLYEAFTYDYSASDYDALVGKKIQVLYVKCDSTKIPYIAINSGADVLKEVIYVRRDSKSEVINNEELHRLIEKRVSTELELKSNIEIEEHLNQLKVLFNTRPHIAFSYFSPIRLSEKNPYAQIDYCSVIDDLIAKKIELIKKIIGV